MEGKKRFELNLEQMNAVVGGISSNDKKKLRELVEACQAAEAAGNEALFESCKAAYNEFIAYLIKEYGLGEVADLFTK